MLVKPQFELQPGQVGKGGIVRDPALYAVVEQRLRDACAALGLRVVRWLDSPIEGGDGNREFFIHAVPCGRPTRSRPCAFRSSFEFFPTKTPEGAVKLRAVRQQLYAQ